MKLKRLVPVLFIILAIFAQFLMQPISVSAAAPSVVTGAATLITTATATVSGNLTGLGGVASASVSFDWGVDTGYTGGTVNANPHVVTANGTSFTAVLSGLTSGTVYHYRARAMNTDGTTLGNDRTLTTQSILTIDITSGSSTGSVTRSPNQSAYDAGSTVTLNATASTGWGFAAWGLVDHVTNDTSASVVMNSNRTVVALFAPNLSSLTRYTSYHSTTDVHTNLGTTGNTTTPGGYFAQTFTSTATHTIKSFRLCLLNENGTVTGSITGGIRAVDPVTGIPYGTDLVTSTPIQGTSVTQDWSVMTFDLGAGYVLQANTSYALVIHSPNGVLYVAEDINNGYPRGQLATGDDGLSWNMGNTNYDAWFEEWGTSSSVMPFSVSTVSASPITTTTASLNGNLVSLGNAASASVYFDWGVDTGYTGGTVNGIPPNVTANGTAFTAGLTGLLPNTQYHFRARAVSNASSVNGGDLPFSTLSIPSGPTIFESYTDATDTTVSGNYTAQTFTPQVTHIITAFSLRLFNSGATGTVTGYLLATSASGAPTGSILVTSPAINESSLSSLAWTDLSFNLGNGYPLQAGTTYALVIHSTSDGLLVQENINGSYPRGQCTGSNDGLVWNMTNTSYDLWFEEMGNIPTYPVTTSVSTAEASAAGCSVTGAGLYAANAPVSVMASAVPGWAFTSWTASGITINPANASLSFNMPTQAVSLNATFNRVYTLSIGINGNGTVTKTPDKATYLYGEKVTLTPSAGSGYTFSGFNPNVDANQQITINGDMTVTATFTKIPVSVVGGGGGGGYIPPPPAPKPVSFSGLSSAGNLVLDVSGRVQDNTGVKSEDGNLTLDIAKNTILCEANGVPLKNLSVKVVAAPPSPPPAKSLLLAYELGPEGALFNPAITLSLAYNPRVLPEGTVGESVTLAFWNGSQWVTVDSKIDKEQGKISASISHFSIWGLLATVIPPPKITLGEIQLSQETVKVGESVTLQASLTNSGGSSGKYSATLKINDSLISSQEITLAAGASQTLSFKVSKDTPGSYTLDLNGKTAKFTVLAPPVSVAPTPVPTQVTITTPTPEDIMTVTPVNLTPSPAAPKPHNQTIIWTITGVLLVACLVVGMVVLRSRSKKN